MSGFTCPYCNMVMSINDNTKKIRHTSFDSSNGIEYIDQFHKPIFHSSSVELKFFFCPNCKEYTMFIEGKGDKVKDINTIIRPFTLAKQYPDYVPQQIRSDYEEACAIINLSPKASATLSRRCLQGIIRDFWGISKGRLYDEITELKDRIQPDLWQAIDNLRQLGNIGAHMEKDTDLIVDIDSGEAEKLIKLIELLMKEWYINREERKQLFGEILQINDEKQAIRKGEG